MISKVTTYQLFNNKCKFSYIHWQRTTAFSHLFVLSFQRATLATSFWSINRLNPMTASEFSSFRCYCDTLFYVSLPFLWTNAALLWMEAHMQDICANFAGGSSSCYKDIREFGITIHVFVYTFDLVAGVAPCTRCSAVNANKLSLVFNFYFCKSNVYH